MKKYTEYRNCFGLYKEQIEEAFLWQEKHEKEKHDSKEPYAGAIGGAYGWKFVTTGLGIIAIYYCNICQANKKAKDQENEINLTDFDNW